MASSELKYFMKYLHAQKTLEYFNEISFNNKCREIDSMSKNEQLPSYKICVCKNGVERHLLLLQQTREG